MCRDKNMPSKVVRPAVAEGSALESSTGNNVVQEQAYILNSNNEGHH